MNAATQGPPGRRSSAPTPILLTLGEAFSYFHRPKELGEDDVEGYDLERALLAISFLAEWSTELGNRDLDGRAAQGLAKLIACCAAHAGRLSRTRRET